MRRSHGFSLVEALVAMTISLAVMGSAFRLMLPTQNLAASRSETADMQQRLRVAADTLYQRIAAAGAGSYVGVDPGPLTDSVASILPYRSGTAPTDPPGSFRSDAITVLTVPRSGAPPSGTTYWLKADAASASYQLMAVESSNGVDVPVVDNVVALAFEYFGDPQPPAMRKPLSDPIGPWTTYGPKPSAAAAALFAAGENCVFVSDVSSPPQPRLAILDASGGPLAALTPSQLTDGPWCPDEGAPDRWDADLLRVRSIGIRIRVQAAMPELRGPAGPWFVHGGTSRGGHQWVPDMEIRLRVSPRNLNLIR
jgi:type II secretory pathway pseudopilin PulG